MIFFQIFSQKNNQNYLNSIEIANSLSIHFADNFQSWISQILFTIERPSPCPDPGVPENGSKTVASADGSI